MRNNEIECMDCFHYSACLFNGEYVPTPCTHFKDKNDVVDVVRCEDCKYWQDNNGGYINEECRLGKEETPDADDYCSYGERKEK